jgi:hypothetical protein
MAPLGFHNPRQWLFEDGEIKLRHWEFEAGNSTPPHGGEACMMPLGLHGWQQRLPCEGEVCMALLGLYSRRQYISRKGGMYGAD